MNNAEFVKKVRGYLEPTNGGVYSMAELWNGAIEALNRLEAAENGLQYWNGIKADNEKLKAKLAAAKKRIEELEKALQDVAPSHHALEEPQE